MVADCAFRNPKNGVWSHDGGAVTLERCAFSGATQWAIQVWEESTAIVANCSFDSNSYDLRVRAPESRIYTDSVVLQNSTAGIPAGVTLQPESEGEVSALRSAPVSMPAADDAAFAALRRVRAVTLRA